jgi:hypothetical protein
MADINTKSCDNCGKIKGENNHWWSILANINKSMFISPYDTNLGPIKIEETTKYISLVACGLECLGILESKIKEGRNPLWSIRF